MTETRRSAVATRDHQKRVLLDHIRILKDMGADALAVAAAEAALRAIDERPEAESLHLSA